MLKTFSIGGVHPHENKLSAHQPIIMAEIPSKAVILLGQHIGAPAKPVVAKGDVVKVGTKIAEPAGFVSAAIHSSVSGKVAKIDSIIDASGYAKPAIFIDVEGDEWEETIDRSETLVRECELTAEEIVKKIADAGIVGLGGACFPTQVKLCPPPSFKAECVIINAVECEPYLTADHQLMLEHAEEIMVGVSILMKAVKVNKAFIGIDKLLNICHRGFPCRYILPYSSEVGVESFTPRTKKLKIAVARDPAFNFIYRENIARLAELGHITYFSPVYGSDLPEADLLYLPGGYPELFARQLHRRKKLMEAIKTFAEEGGKVLAECGGMMFLTRSLTARQGGTAYAMAGVLPLDCTMVGARLHLGYRRLEYNGLELKGHEFHYSNIIEPDALPSVAKQFTVRGMEVNTPLYRYKNVIAGYTHLYWGEADILKLWEE